jgi:ABC-2 type transport system permease protein
MISFPSIWAITLRHSRLLMRDTNLKLAHFYWPLLDVLIWGFLGSWIQKMQGSPSHNYEAIALLGILLWQTAARSSIVTMQAFLEELWAQNLINLFSLPMSLAEWILGVMLYNGIMSIVTVFYCVGLIFLLYKLSIWYLLSTFLIFAPPLFISGLCIGFACLCCIAYLGKRAQELGFVFAWFFAPFSTAFYPMEVLPPWAQAISYCLPMSHVFMGMRKYLIEHQDPTPYLIKGYAMSCGYATIAVVLFVFLFQKSKQKGLARLSD